MTARALRKRLDRLEASLGAPADWGASALPPLSVAKARIVLAMLIEMGALEPPAPGTPDRWRELRSALYGPDDPSMAHDAGT